MGSLKAKFSISHLKMEVKFLILLISILAIFWILVALQKPVLTDEAGHMGSAQMVSYVLERISGDPGLILDFSRIKENAFEYYVHHPNVTILFNPPFLQLLTGFFFFIFGPSVFLARLVSMTMSILSVVMMYLVGKRYYSPRIGLYSSILLGSSEFMLSLGGIMMLDITMLAFVLVFIYYFLDFENKSGRHHLYLIPLCVAPIIRFDAVLIFFSIFLYILFSRDWRILKEKQTYLYGVPLFFLLVIPLLFVLFTFNGGDIVSFITGGKIDEITIGFVDPFEVIRSISDTYYHLLTIPLFLIPLAYFSKNRRKMTDRENYLFVLYISPFLFLFLWSIYSVLTGGSVPWCYISSGRFFSTSLPTTCLFIAILIKKYVRNEKLLLGSLFSFFIIQLVLSSGYVRDYGYMDASQYVWDNIAVHGNVLNLEFLDGLITPFSMMDSNLEHAVLRARDCVLANLTLPEFKAYLNENNVQYVISTSRINQTDARAYLFTIEIHDQLMNDPGFEKHTFSEVIVFENKGLDYPLAETSVCQDVCYVTDNRYCSVV